jgi:hypothetical protein
MTELKELDVARTKETLFGLPAGTVGTIVHVYERPVPGWCEFETKGNETFTIPLSNLEKVEGEELG